MKKYFWVICLFSVYSLTNSVYSQDIIKTKAGEEIKARVLKITKKGTTYKPYEDPEFSTYSLPYKELASIQKEGEKKPMLFNHKLPRGYVSLSIGPPGMSIPMGSFAQESYDNVKAEPGFAKEGTNLKFDVAFYLWKRLGLSIGTGYTFYKFSYEDYKTNLFGDPQPAGDIVVDYLDNSGFSGTTRFRDTRWTFKQAMIGPIYSFKIGRIITQDIKVRVGFIETTKPPIYVRYFDNSGTAGAMQASFSYGGASKTDFSYNLGTSTRIAFTKRLALCLAADFVHTSPVMDIQVSQMVNGVFSQPNASVQYEISSLNLSLGLAYQFKRKKNKFE